MTPRGLLLALVLVALVLVAAGCGGSPTSAPPESAGPPPTPTPTPTRTARPSSPPPPTPTRTPPPAPLAGVVVALDPGHQLGNARFPDQVNRLVDAGGLRKACNTTGTATDAGVPESTVVLALARAVQRRLERLGAAVRLTRTTDSAERWGPCIDERGRFAGRVGADLLVSLHADGSDPGATGFHVISDGDGASRRLSVDLAEGLSGAGLPRSSYVGGGTGLDVRDDLGTLNLATVPAAMVEIGNMRNAVDAARMTSPAGRAAYARGVVAGVRAFFGRRS